jgi:hypothetical protein
MPGLHIPGKEVNAAELTPDHRKCLVVINIALLEPVRHHASIKRKNHEATRRKSDISQVLRGWVNSNIDGFVRQTASRANQRYQLP